MTIEQSTEITAIPFEQPRMVAGWRSEPPTVPEVRRWALWWHRAPGEVEHIVELDVGLREALPTVLVDGRFPLRADDWGGDEAQWALALPPGIVL